MATLDVINFDKKKVGSITLSDDVFASVINVPLVHQVIKAQLADRRQGTAKTKVKSEVRGGGRKPFKQKGTGNARQGSSRSPLNPGGGQSFGPQPRSYKQYTTKEMVRGALRSALSDRMKANRILIIDDMKLASHKTKSMNEIIRNKLQLDRAVFIEDENTQLERAARNIRGMKVLRTAGINVYDIIRSPWIVFSKKSVHTIEERLKKGK